MYKRQESDFGGGSAHGGQKIGAFGINGLVAGVRVGLRFAIDRVKRASAEVVSWPEPRNADDRQLAQIA